MVRKLIRISSVFVTIGMTWSVPAGAIPSFRIMPDAVSDAFGATCRALPILAVPDPSRHGLFAAGIITLLPDCRSQGMLNPICRSLPTPPRCGEG
jgi:hypothetical protein